MLNFIRSLAVLAALSGNVLAQGFAPIGPSGGGGGSGGGGSGTVTSIATGCQATGGTITTTGTISTQQIVNSQSGSNYAIVTGDCGKLDLLSNASPQIPTIAAAGSAGFASGWYVDVYNSGAGTQTITPTTSTINGAATYALLQNQGIRIISDGTNYQVMGSAANFNNKAAPAGVILGTTDSQTVTNKTIAIGSNTLTGVAPLASPTFTGVPAAPTASAGDNTTQIATDAFVTTAVNNAIAGVNPAIAVKAATTAAGDTSGYTYANGASGIGATLTGPNNTATTIDGVTFTTVGQRLLVKNDTQSPSGAFNGIYSLTALHTGITGDIFTRALDYDQPSDMNNTGAIPVVSGTANASTSWLLTSAIVTVGTDPLTFTQFSINPTTVVTTSTLATNAAKGIMEGDGASVSCVAGVCNSPVLSPMYVNVSGMYYQQFGIGSAAAGAGVAGTTYLTPIWVGKPITISGIAIKFGTECANAGNVCTTGHGVALYANSGNRPNGAPLAYGFTTAGVAAPQTVAFTSPGATYSITTPGWYWLGYQYGDTTERLFAILLSPIALLPGNYLGSGTLTSLITGVSGVSVTGGVAGSSFPSISCPTNCTELLASASLATWTAVDISSVP